MKDEKWTEEIFDSLEGIKRAKPDTKLFDIIENQIFSEETKVVSFNRIKYAAVAAIFILLINVISLRTYSNSVKTEISYENNSERSYGQQLISSYKIYE